MDAETLYNTILRERNLTAYALEKMLNFANGSINSAIRNKSGVKSTSLDKIKEVFPDINTTWLYTGLGEPFAPDDHMNYREKYYVLLEKYNNLLEKLLNNQ